MVAENFPKVLPLVLRHEGGFVNHPKDPGGATNRGVTQATYDAFRDRHNRPRQSVREITDAEVHAVYRAGYWAVCQCDGLPAGIDYAVFDAAVNSGPARAAKWLQRAVGARVDGVIGPQTLKAARLAEDKAGVVKKICAARLSFMQSLRIWSTFGRGWMRRVTDVEAVGVKMALESAGFARPSVEAILGSEGAEAKAVSDRQSKGAGGAGAVGGGGIAGGDQLPAELPVDAALAPWLVWGGVALALVLAGWLAWRWYVNSTRAQSYAAAVRVALNKL